MNIKTNGITKFLTIATACLLVQACSSDENPFVGGGGGTAVNTGTISDKNFRLGADLSPAVLNTNGTLNFVEVDVTINIGDRNNQILTDSHTVFFATEWGLIEESCVTEDGFCSVKWQTSDGSNFPANDTGGRTAGSPGSTIVAYTLGEESFNDLNDNGSYDDIDGSFTDIEEPYIDVNRNGIHDVASEPIIDVVNGNDPAGANGVHDIADGFFNGPGCTHTVNCSLVSTSFIWGSLALKLDGPAIATIPTFTIGGSTMGLTGTVVLQNNGGDNLSVTGATFTFATGLADLATYAVTVLTQPANQFCTVTSGGGAVAAANVTSVTVNCVPTFSLSGTINGAVGFGGNSLILQNNGGDDETITSSTATPYTFNTRLVAGVTYTITVSSNPAGVTCTITVGGTETGTMPAANVTGIDFTCI